ncbi:alpha/beta fold hydrolase [Geodermatophilus sabuli]|uniref:alpha/beta fold hydrolase n=1 Tax=Geodermatophilus sabuli TaxID=1564158 RepID=UPI0015587A72|nr:alpha/beta fold hydrolase [Geodermatophilus sabuli]MBB3083061.1 pimeloyl-ACP methyl ester carboxylesterase/enamine deaminase RidA (YjgF/YER057c/UK114 family) [Geodermatophilus sabuli]
MVLLHGVGARADRWRDNLAALVDAGFHVFALDFPGHGFAQKGSGLDHSVPGFAQFVREVLDALGIASVAIVGTSLGGHVAARLAVDEPDRVTAVVLVGPMGLVPVGAGARQALADAVVETSREAIARKLRVLVHDEDLVTESWVEEEWRINNSGGAVESMSSLAAYFAERIDDDLVGGELARSVPTVRCLLVWGSDDLLVPTELAQPALAVLPAGTQLVLVEGAGHAPYLERPGAFNRAVVDFLTDAAARPSSTPGREEIQVSSGDRREVRVHGLAEPLSHYTDIVVHQGVAYVSGCISVDEAGQLVGEGDVVAQTRQSLCNMQLALRSVGSSLADVLKVTVFLTDISDRTRINPVRQEFFGEFRPASTLVQVSALAVPGAAVEIEAVAAVHS